MLRILQGGVEQPPITAGTLHPSTLVSMCDASRDSEACCHWLCREQDTWFFTKHWSRGYRETAAVVLQRSVSKQALDLTVMTPAKTQQTSKISSNCATARGWRQVGGSNGHDGE